jgi:polysaccharide pyruvyl transferase WcaK-like protein
MSSTVEDDTGEFEDEPESYIDDGFKSFFREIVEDTEYSICVIPKKLAREVLTQKRLEIIQVLRDNDFSSKRDLARYLERDIKSVSRDLDVLWDCSVINYTEEGNRKIPQLSAEKIIVEPL